MSTTASQPRVLASDPTTTISHTGDAAASTISTVSPSHSSVRALSPVQVEAVRRRLTSLRDSCRTQKELAQRLGLSQQTLSRVLSGTSEPPGLMVAQKLASALRMSLDQVLSMPNNALDEALAAYPDRWSGPAIAAVRAMPETVELSAIAISRLLDSVTEALRPVHRSIRRK